MNNPPNMVLYGTSWCPDCRRAKKFLGEHLIPYEWVDIEQDRDAEAYVLQINQGKRIIPTIVFEDGSFLVEPSNAALAQKMGMKTAARLPYYDLLIIGGGPTGLTAAIYAAREGVETLLIESSGLGGQAGLTAGIENFPGFPEGISGAEFADRVVQQARRFDVEILQAQEIARLLAHDGYLCAQNGDGEHYHGKAILIATGASYRRLGVPGEEDLIGAGIHFCATCDGPFYKGAQEIAVIGGGNSAAEESLHLTRFAEKVRLLVRGESLSASKFLVDKLNQKPDKIQIQYRTVVEGFTAKGSNLKSIQLKNLDSGEVAEISPSAAFIFIGQEPNSQLVKELLVMDPGGFIYTGHDLAHLDLPELSRERFAFETSMPGIFAAGDVRHGSTNQVASAVGEGAAAAIAIRQYLKETR